MAEFFSSNGQHEKAVELLVRSKQIEMALDLCATHNIVITEEMAENMTLPKAPEGIYMYTLVKMLESYKS